MSEFIVLGLIPGTHTELTFTFWLLAVTGLLVALLAWRLWRGNGWREVVVTVRIFVATRQTLPALNFGFGRDTFGV